MKQQKSGPSFQRVPGDTERNLDGLMQRALWNFLSVVELKSLTAAARVLGTHKTALSRQLARLEHDLGVTLISRTTRQFSVTSQGQRLYERVRPLWQELRQALESTREPSHPLRGHLRLTAPEDWGNAFVTPWISQFARLHPGAHIELHFSNDVLDLVQMKIDVAFRMGRLKDSRIRQRRIGALEFVLVASPDWCARHHLQHPERLGAEKLNGLAKISFGAPTPRSWHLHRGGQTQIVPPQATLVANHFSTVVDLARRGNGVAAVPKFLVQTDLKTRSLIRVCSDWTLDEIPIHMAFPAVRHQTPTVRAFVELVTASMRAVRSTP